VDTDQPESPEPDKPAELGHVGPAAEALFEMLSRWFDTGGCL
jgi:hypothetical protein